MQPGLRSCKKERDYCSQPISGHPEGAITFWVIIFFSEGLRTKRVEASPISYEAVQSQAKRSANKKT